MESNQSASGSSEIEVTSHNESFIESIDHLNYPVDCNMISTTNQEDNPNILSFMDDDTIYNLNSREIEEIFASEMEIVHRNHQNQEIQATVSEETSNPIIENSNIDINQQETVVPMWYHSNSFVSKQPVTTTNIENVSDQTIITNEKKYNILPYPPSSTSTKKTLHYRPYFEYIDIDSMELLRSAKFDLSGGTMQRRRLEHNFRLAARSVAISATTQTSILTIMNEIHRQFDDTLLRYACVGVTKNDDPQSRCVYIQIIFKRRIDTRVYFLDEITHDEHCNYFVTNKDRPWNEFIKRSTEYLEYGTFESVYSRIDMGKLTSQKHTKGKSSKKNRSRVKTQIKQLASNGSVNLVNNQNNLLDSTENLLSERIPTNANINTVVENTDDIVQNIQHTTDTRNSSKKPYCDLIASKAFDMAEASIIATINHMKDKLPYEFTVYGTTFLEHFRSLHREHRDDMNPSESL